jgi:hypothetical protein
MNQNIRVSDADRERVAEGLREHYAEGRLSAEELDERITKTLNAKTVADLGAVMTDLPDDQRMAQQPQLQAPKPPRWSGRPVVVYRRGPRILPLLVLALIAAVAIPGAGWIFVAFLKVALLFWLVACIAGIFAANRFRRRFRRLVQQPGVSSKWQQSEWRR